MAEGSPGHPTGSLTPDEVAKRAETRARNAADIAVIAKTLNTLKELPKEFVEAIKRQVNLESKRQPNSLYTRIIDFILGKEVIGVDQKPPGKGKSVDDMTLFMAFRVAATDMNKVIYQGQDNGVWISAVKKGKDTLYTYMGEGNEAPEGYPGPIRRKRGENKDE